MRITPQDIHNQEFKRSLRGYDLDEVDAFLQQVADELEGLVDENQHLKDSVKDLDARLSDYRKKDDMLEKTLITAQKMTDEMKDIARREAEAAAGQAKAEAQKIVAEAHRQLVRFQAQLDDMKRYRDAFVIQFKAFLDQQYRFLADFAKSGSSPQLNAPAPGSAPPPAVAPEAKSERPARPRAAAPPPGAPAPVAGGSRAPDAGSDKLEIEVANEGSEDEEPVG
jgi:cell division initiation protein